MPHLPRDAADHEAFLGIGAVSERFGPKEPRQLAGLTGGVFQNRRLTDTAQRLLEQAGFRVHLTDALPCNDAGIAFGQIVEAVAAGVAR